MFSCVQSCSLYLALSSRSYENISKARLPATEPSPAHYHHTATGPSPAKESWSREVLAKLLAHVDIPS